MNRWHNYYIDGMIHFCTATVQDWQPRLDDNATCILYKEWNLIRYKLNIKIIAYVIMPDHIHMLLWSDYGRNIQLFMQQILSRSSKEIGRGGKFWKERMRVVPVYSSNIAKSKLDYIHNNPLKRKLIENPENWPHSSFAQLVNGKSNTPFCCDPWPEILLLK